MTLKFISVIIVATCLNVALTSEDNIDEDSQVRSNIEKTVGRSYSLTTCDYRAQVGFTCLTCNRALHCYPGNVAILVDCYGLFRFCRDGRCSRFQGDKCFTDSKVTTPNPGINGSDITNVIVTSTEATTRHMTEVTEAPAIVASITNADVTTKTTTANADVTTKTTTTIADATTYTATTAIATTDADQSNKTSITIADATTKAATENSDTTNTVT